MIEQDYINQAISQLGESLPNQSSFKEIFYSEADKDVFLTRLSNVLQGLNVLALNTPQEGGFCFQFLLENKLIIVVSKTSNFCYLSSLSNEQMDPTNSDRVTEALSKGGFNVIDEEQVKHLFTIKVQDYPELLLSVTNKDLTVGYLLFGFEG